MGISLIIGLVVICFAASYFGAAYAMWDIERRYNRRYGQKRNHN